MEDKIEDLSIDELIELCEKKVTIPLKKYIKRYFKLLENNNRISIETLNLLHQSNNTIININRLLRRKEIVDSATLMRSCFEKIMMAMMIHFDNNTYEEFKNLEKCGKSDNTRPTKLLNNFIIKLKDINGLVINDFSDEEIKFILTETYDKLCLYTHSSIAVSFIIELNKNKDENIVLAFFYSVVSFLEMLLYSCLKYLCEDEENHIDVFCIFLKYLLYFNEIDYSKLNREYLSKYDKYLYLDVNNNINDKYKKLVSKILEEIRELNELAKSNKYEIDKYIEELLTK